jgi:PPOX class probable F420-dependent enzyme
MPENMTPDQRREFLTHGTRNAVVATVRPDGRPHAVPVWYALDGDDILISVGEQTVKGRNLAHDPRTTIVVEDPAPPYSFVSIDGTADLLRDPGDIRDASRKIAHRYLPPEAVDGWVEYATGPGKVIARISPTHTVAVAKVGG